MANVKKCDLCGAIYDQTNAMLYRNRNWNSPMVITLRPTTNPLLDNPVIWAEYEVCKDCLGSIENHIHNLKIMK